MSARDVIAKADVEFLSGVPVHPTLEGADAIIAALTAAGFRILGPEDIDPITVERCAGDVRGMQLGPLETFPWRAISNIRSLSKEGGEE